MIASNDTPVTDAELDSFYGTPPTQAEINEVILRQKRAFDADDLAEIAHANSIDLLAALESKDAIRFFTTFNVMRKLDIANRASIELFGRVGVIKMEEV